MTDQGKLEYYLEVEISRLDENTLLLLQTAYAMNILNIFKMDDYNPSKTPVPRSMNLSWLDSPDEVDPILQRVYRAIIGSLMYFLSLDPSGFWFRCKFSESFKVSS